MFFTKFYPLYRPQVSTSLDWKTDLSIRQVLYLGRTPESLQQSVYTLQHRLIELGYLHQANGKFDEGTKQAVETFQRQQGLKVDGIVGPLTWAALLYPKLSININTSEEQRSFIQDLQHILKEEGFYLEITGEFDRQTDKALRSFQRYYGLRPDGFAGPITWTMLKGQRPVPKPTIWPLSRLTYRCERILEQLLIIASVWIGILWNPFNVQQTELSLLAALVVAYSLTIVGSSIFEKVLPKLHLGDHGFILRYSPYVLIGLLWEPILQFITAALS
jgi:hypothetical protein